MKFIRIGDETIRLDLITHVKEGCKEETLYGRSVRKTTDHRFGWLEVHFVSGEVLKVEGEGAEVLRRVLEEETSKGNNAPPLSPAAARKVIPREQPVAETLSTPPSPHARRENAPRPVDDQRNGLRNGFGQ